MNTENHNKPYCGGRVESAELTKQQLKRKIMNLDVDYFFWGCDLVFGFFPKIR